MKESDLPTLAQVSRVVASLDQPAGNDGNTPLGDLVGVHDDPFEEEVERAMILDRVREAVDALDGLERQVVRIRFGLDGDGPASLQTTASRLGIGVRRARQAEARAMQQLAELASSKPLTGPPEPGHAPRTEHRLQSGRRRVRGDRPRDAPPRRMVEGQAVRVKEQTPGIEGRSAPATMASGREAFRHTGRRHPPDGRSQPCAPGPDASGRSRASLR